jgi:hypothetical protein
MTFFMQTLRLCIAELINKQLKFQNLSASGAFYPGLQLRSKQPFPEQKKQSITIP